MTAARMALFLEAGHDDVLRDALGRGRAVFGEQISGAFAALGAPDPALATDLLAVCFEGMFLHRIARHAEIDVRAILTTVVHSLL
jgi:hypothetical protein